MGIDISVFHYLPPPDLLTPNFAPRIFLSAISWDKNAPRLSEAVEGLPSGAKATAHIGSLQFDRRNGMRLRYRVRPEQASWTESSSLDLALGSLSSGPHSLEVQARVFTGPWSPVLTRSFTVQRPMWRSVPLLFLYALTGCFIAVGGYLMHRRRMAEEAQLLPALGDLRLRTLSLDADGLTGTLLDSRFEVGDLLARGGFANVMAGYDRAQKRRCAVKVFRNELRNQDWIQWRFVQEVAALEKIRHPHVVSIYAHGNTPSGAPYLVMEFVEGKNMGEVLEGGALSPRRAAKLLRQLGGALEAVHAQGIWHRDVKPENIIVRDEASEEESAVLIDFSLAIVKNANESLYGNTTQAAGTPHYMAPEQSMGYASASSDIYSLAKVVIELLAGKRLHEILPSASPDLADKVRELLKGETLDVHLSQNAIEALCSAVEFDPAKRPHAAALFADMLARELESDSPIQEG
jgi:tRNA A-37 threonylcarbamoyl transferase component Bud32